MKNFWGIFALALCIHTTAQSADITGGGKIDAFITRKLKTFDAGAWRLRKTSGKFEQLPEGYLLPRLFIACRAIKESAPQYTEKIMHGSEKPHTPDDCVVYGCKVVLTKSPPKVAYYEVEYTICKRDTLDEVSAAVFFFVLEHLLNNSKTHTGPYRLLVSNPEEVQSDLNFLEKKPAGRNTFTLPKAPWKTLIKTTRRECGIQSAEEIKCATTEAP